MTVRFRTQKTQWVIGAILLLSACGSTALQSSDAASNSDDGQRTTPLVTAPYESDGISTSEALSTCTDPDYESPEMNLANVLDEVDYWIAVNDVGDFSSENVNEFLPVAIDGVRLNEDENQASTFQVAVYGDLYLSIVKALEHPDSTQAYLPVKPPIAALDLGDDDGRAVSVIVELADGTTVLGGDCFQLNLAKALALNHGDGLVGFAAAATELTGTDLTEFAFPGSTR